MHKGPCRTPVPQQSNSSPLSTVIILRIQERYGVDSAQISGLGMQWEINAQCKILLIPLISLHNVFHINTLPEIDTQEHWIQN